MADQLFTGHTKYGTVGGIITIFLVNISSGDMVRTMVLAAIGAVVSFTVSLALKYCIRKWHRIK
jgi:hypothetical protein